MGIAENKLNDQDVTDIDKALAAAKARKAAKAGGTATPATPTEKKPKITDEERAARTALLEQQRAERKATKEQARAAKLAERQNGKQPAHMRKVMKAAEKLSPLSQAAELLLNEATTNLTQAELASLASHIAHFNRTKATERALTSTVEIGQSVEIVGGDPRYVGKRGTVVKSQRIRCYVNIPGENNRPIPGVEESGIYFFISEVAPVAEEAAQNDNTTEHAATG